MLTFLMYMLDIVLLQISEQMKDGIASGILITNKVTDITVEHNSIIGTSSGEGVGIGVNCNETTTNHYPTGIVIRYNDIRVS